MSKAPVLIVPGWGDSGPEHWQSLWETAHSGLRRVVQRDWLAPRCDDWVQALRAAIDASPAPPVVAAHSLGCHALAHLAARGGPAIHGALLVAPPDVETPQFPDVIQGFAPVPRTRLPFPSVMVASSDDPFATIERSRELAAAWGSRLVEIGAHGHINTDAGFGPWPQGEALLDALRAQ
ncbi:MAG TPA: alpha/beta hydrolase [Methylomirabilota bacterium]|nr:alpha/beta hydrolase [Methylomirabilota bacterium]